MNSNFIKTTGVIPLLLALSTWTMAADPPKIGSTAYGSYLGLQSMPGGQLVELVITPPQDPMISFHSKVEQQFRSRISETLSKVAENPVGAGVLRTLLAYRQSGEPVKMIFRKGSMRGREVIAGVGQPGKDRVIPIYCFPDNTGMFSSVQLGLPAGLAVDPSAKVQYEAIPGMSDDEQLAHELIHVIRIVAKTSLDPRNQAPLTIELYSRAASDPDQLETIRALWQSDEETEVITGKKLKTVGRFKFSEFGYSQASRPPVVYPRVFALTMGPNDDDSLPESRQDLVKFYQDSPLSDIMSLKGHAVTRSLYE
ncbi:MAG: hypothetical protein LBC25_02170 [Holosporales bacterium]|jgi:hypothetical protein|nr:hypothetical protein [Holosporales bacterium]